MDAAGSQEITGLLQAWGKGQTSALDDLVPLVYRELKRLARRHMRGSDCGTLQTTALVHEAYLKLVALSSVRWQDRAHFFAVSAQIMRRILVNAARARRSQKRWGLLRAANRPFDLDLDQVPDMGFVRADEILAIHEALDRLAQMDPRQAQVVEMRFFGGLTVEEVAEVLKISAQSVLRDWKLAKAWLRREVRTRKDGLLAGSSGTGPRNTE
jgi:RNA polymerase sigma factor (TIGR02999 family)